MSGDALALVRGARDVAALRLHASQHLLNRYQVRGAFANYYKGLVSDFKSIAASGWGPELIPDEEILQSQFPEILEELEQAQTRLAELRASGTYKVFRELAGPMGPVAAVPGVGEVAVALVWEPPWTPDRITDAGKRALGWTN